MFETLDNASSPSATLCEFYRYAILLTGDADLAEAALAHAQAAADAHRGQLRNDGQRQVWLAARIREFCRCSTAPTQSEAPRLLREAGPEGFGEVLGIEAYIVARRFCALPEPDRTALALFYLDLLELEQIAEVLEMRLEAVAAVIGRARRLLQETLAAPCAQGASSSP